MKEAKRSISRCTALLFSLSSINALGFTVITELNNDNKSISKLRCTTAFHKADKIFKCPTESKEILFNGIERGNETENHNKTLIMLTTEITQIAHLNIET